MDEIIKHYKARVQAIQTHIGINYATISDEENIRLSANVNLFNEFINKLEAVEKESEKVSNIIKKV